MTLHGTLQDAQFISFLEKIGRETTATFSTHDWLILDRIAREQKLQEPDKARLQRLRDLGIIERAGKRFLLSRRYYEFAGRRAVYTRMKGLDREQNIALLLKHIEEFATTGGAKREDLLQVLPNLPGTTIRSLLETLRRRGMAHPEGEKRGSRWFPGPEGPESGGRRRR